MKTTLSAASLLMVLAGIAFAEKNKATETGTTAVELNSTYALNEARFDEEFTGKVITVTGNVRAIRKGTHRRYTVQVETALDVSIVFFVDLKHRKELATYSPGDEVSFRGKCIGALIPESDARRSPEIQILNAEPLGKKRAQSDVEPPPKPTF